MLSKSPALFIGESPPLPSPSAANNEGATKAEAPARAAFFKKSLRLLVSIVLIFLFLLHIYVNLLNIQSLTKTIERHLYGSDIFPRYAHLFLIERI